ncbi:hypothetical protein N7460_006623, partial [Penicillium canescens]
MASITDLQESATWHAVLPANRPSTYPPSNAPRSRKLHMADNLVRFETPPRNSQQTPSSTTAFSSPKRSTPTADSSTQTTDDSSTKNTNLDCRFNPLPAIIYPEPQQPPTTQSPQLHQTIPSITSSPQNRQTTYASVLQRPVTSIPQPTPPVQEPFLPANPILTIEDLHLRFHNKPSPFQFENKTSQRSIKRTRNKTASVTQSLSRFLASALPAFS